MQFLFFRDFKIETKLLLVVTAVFVALFAAGAFLYVSTAQAAAVTSVQSGNWSDPAVWSTGTVPAAGDTVTITAGHTVTYDVVDSQISGMTIEAGAKVTFDPSKTTILKTDKNVVVFGELEMRPSSPTVHQTIRFVNVDETKFVGGGMAVLDTDVGLWVRGTGVLNVAGSSKTAWTRLAGSANAGDTTIVLQIAPSGWQVGDEISVVPTESLTVGNASWNGFDVRTITAVSGNTITVSSPLSRNHPAAVDPFSGNTYTAEVLNLTRNVHIEGTGDGSPYPERNGRAHIQFHTTVPQFVSYAEFKLMGPRQYTGELNFTAGVLGRYAFHFHHGRDGTRGSIIEGTVVRDAGFHAYVPHASHGITFRDTISYNTFDQAYWWDPPPDKVGRPGVHSTDPVNDTDDVLYDHAVAAIVKVDPDFRGGGITGFALNPGVGNTIQNSVAVGVQGNSNANGFTWPEAGSARPGLAAGVWGFSEGNIAHNNKRHGIFTWQNTPELHIVEDVVLYNNGASGVTHGAYVNSYRYLNVEAFGNGGYGLEVHSAARDSSLRTDGYSQSFENYKTDGLLIFPAHNADVNIPTLFKDCILAGVIVDDTANTEPTRADFVNCTKPNGQSIEPADFTLKSVVPGMDIRVQRPDGTAYHIDEAGTVTSITAFYTVSSAGVPTISSANSRHIFLDRLEKLVFSGLNFSAEPYALSIKQGTNTVRTISSIVPKDSSTIEVDFTKQDLSSLTPGSYSIELERVSDGVKVAYTNQVVFTKLGDIWSSGADATDPEPRDGKIDINDVTRMFSSFGKTSGQSGFNAEADINGPTGSPDGKIDIYDANKVMANWTG